MAPTTGRGDIPATAGAIRDRSAMAGTTEVSPTGADTREGMAVGMDTTKRHVRHAR